MKAAVYYSQAREGMYEAMRPCVTLVNLIALTWFIALQYFRFRDAGRSCSGDYLAHSMIMPLQTNSTNSVKLPSWILREQGFWMLLYVVAQYFLYFLCKISTTIIYNRLEAEFEEIKA